MKMILKNTKILEIGDQYLDSLYFLLLFLYQWQMVLIIELIALGVDQT